MLIERYYLDTPIVRASVFGRPIAKMRGLEPSASLSKELSHAYASSWSTIRFLTLDVSFWAELWNQEPPAHPSYSWNLTTTCSDQPAQMPSARAWRPTKWSRHCHCVIVASIRREHAPCSKSSYSRRVNWKSLFWQVINLEMRELSRCSTASPLPKNSRKFTWQITSLMKSQKCSRPSRVAWIEINHLQDMISEITTWKMKVSSSCQFLGKFPCLILNNQIHFFVFYTWNFWKLLTRLQFQFLYSIIPTWTNPMLPILAVIFFTEMLGPEEEGKISHVTEIEISERATGKK